MVGSRNARYKVLRWFAIDLSITMRQAEPFPGGEKKISTIEFRSGGSQKAASINPIGSPLYAHYPVGI